MRDRIQEDPEHGVVRIQRLQSLEEGDFILEASADNRQDKTAGMERTDKASDLQRR